VLAPGHIVQDGVDAAQDRADPEAAAAAARDRRSLHDDRGDDPNASGQRVELLRTRLGDRDEISESSANPHRERSVS
jgi:hypothetical protein